MNIGTVFSGIGAPEQAFNGILGHNKVKVLFACDNGEIEIPLSKEQILEESKNFKSLEDCVVNIYSRFGINYMQRSYLANYKTETFYQDIRFIDGKKYKGKLDFYIGGSPCQSFSTVGKQLGLKDTRGTLFYEFARLVKEIEPKVFIYENVRGLLTNDKGNTFKTILHILNDELHYHISYDVFNATEFGIPQNRRRLIIVGTKDNFNFDVKNIQRKNLNKTMQDFLEDNCKDGCFKYRKGGDIVILKQPGTPNPKAILSPLVTKYVLKGGTKNFYTKPVTDLPIARTLLKTMGNHHRAGVDNYITIGKEKNIYRALTPRECLRLMGFTDDFQFPDIPWSKMYMQAGNSIVVDLLMAVIKSLRKEEIL